MEVEERLFVRNKAMWLNVCNHNYKADYIPSVTEVENGIILPTKLLEGTPGYSAGGVCDKDFNFVGGLRRDPKGPGFGGVCEGYKVDKKDLDFVEETVVFGGVIIAHFGHMLIDNLTRLWWHVQNKNSSYKICFVIRPFKSYEWLFDFFNLLEIDRSRIMIVEKPTQFAKIIVPEEAAHSWDCYTDLWELPYKLIAENAIRRVNINELPKKIYLTKRLYKAGANTLNEEYFENYYKSKGYEVIVPEKLPLFQQIALAANAEAIATTLGSTSHFNLFSKKGSRIDILTRVDNQVINTQCMINQMKEADWYIIDVSMNYLFGDRFSGVVYLDKTEQWKKFIKLKFGDCCDDSINISANYNYVLDWTKFYLENPGRFNDMKYSEMSGYNFLRQMSKVLLNKEPDQSKYNLQNSSQNLKITISKLQKEAEDSKKHTADLQGQIETKEQRISQLENENAHLTKLNTEFNESIKLYKKADEDNADLQSSNAQLDNKLKEEKIKYEELLNKHFKLAEDLTLCQTQISETNGNIVDLYTKLTEKDSDIKAMQNQNNVLQNENKILQQEYKTLQEKNSKNQEVLLKAREEISERDKKIIHLEQSISFRLGMAITFIPRKIKGLFRKKK